jgi:putative heme-binding domain-containing protein
MICRLVFAVSFALVFTFVCAAQNSAALTPEKRAYADFGMRADGDVSRGKQLFADEQKLACAKCHSIDGTSSKAGPDLSSIGDKFPRRELIRAVMEPSASIAVGYATTIVETKTGDEFQGVIKQATDAWLELKGADGPATRVATRDIKEQRASDVSLMPEGLEAGITHQQFADLIAYLETLRQPENLFASTRGMPAVIPIAARPAEFVPLFDPSIRFNHPVWFSEVPGFTNLFVALEQAGKALLVERTAAGDRQTTLLDISANVRAVAAMGLLGGAFHPKFRENRKYYLKYQTVENGRISTLVIERKFSADFKSDSGEPARQLMKIPGVTQDHNGGCIEFGPDGFLYLGMGDSGPQQDPQGHGQDLTTFLGKILRIDVDHQEAGRAYAIPSENPFRTNTAARPEIWAFGFREPWRFSFDRKTRDLWVGDVGQDKIEEVTIVRAGENHGWNVFEGFTPFSNRYRRDNEKYVAPIFAYPHRVGVSITAGYVYRGARAPLMEGRHICGDYETRRVWALVQTNRVLSSVVEIGRAPSRVVSFAQDSHGELFLVGFDDGVIYRINLAAVDPTPLESRVIAETAERASVQWRFSLRTPAADWFRPEFNDSSWTNAPGGFGMAGTPGAAVRTEWRTSDIWLRREFTVTNASLAGASLALRLHHDEDVEVYINGVEAARLPRWTTGYIEVPLTGAAVQAVRAGRNVIAIHCHQNGGGQYIDAGVVAFVKPAQLSARTLP